MPNDFRAKKRWKGSRTPGQSRSGPGRPRILLRRLGPSEGPRDDGRRAEPQPGCGFPVLFQRHDRGRGPSLLPAQGLDIPGRIGLAGFNGVELLDGLPRQLATMDACRLEIGAAPPRSSPATAQTRSWNSVAHLAAGRYDPVIVLLFLFKNIPAGGF